jgi:hypothetical protein
VVFVFEQRKVEFAVETLVEHLAEFSRVLVSIGANREDLDSLLLLLSQQTFQLPELFYAVGSPVAAVENQNHGFPASEIR